MWKREREREVSKLERKALEGKFLDFTKGYNAYPLGHVIIKEFEASLITDKPETPDQLDEVSLQLRIWHSDERYQDDGNKEKRRIALAIEWE